MTINYLTMPNRVNVIYGPVVEFPAPELARTVRDSFAERGCAPFSSLFDCPITAAQFVLRRDFNYFMTPAFFMGFHGAIGEGILGDWSDMSRKPLAPLAQNVDAARFSRLAGSLMQNTEILAKRYKGTIKRDNAFSYVEISLPYYSHSLFVAMDGTLLSNIHPESRRQTLPYPNPGSSVASDAYPRKISTGNSKWRGRLKYMSAETWFRLKEHSRFPSFRQDEYGPYFVCGRSGGGKIIRPKDCRPA